ncbi:SIR2 family NAD-dependent protein deacylase [Yinghuangia seranimata]|uniref:SIR2 family NAD-dependent protein deacylase n=1 Tax=Yinghuangia seranimata TaxID=408067 RepID=UPI00248C1DA0|nr:Sir2 family NAD-dependent protein deacetylase [Yinghuangia seranimata]MDI2126345.1 Sir2 family NAD-dependent protein deacetylase [Yinghuangia seranimata]
MNASVREWIRASDSITVLTGAGISTDSGIPDYRGPQGVWTTNPDAEKLVRYPDYMGDADIRRRSWLARRDNPARLAQPNAGHRALVELERSGRLLGLVTQNVDGLHVRAGNSAAKVIELHGTMFEVVCTDCGHRTTLDETLARVDAGEDDPRCTLCGGIQKTATIMFGQALERRVLERAAIASQVCDLFLAVGTSLQVEPAASLCRVAREAGARLVVVNAEETPYDAVADAVLREPIGTVLPELVDGLGPRDGVSAPE